MKRFMTWLAENNPDEFMEPGDTAPNHSTTMVSPNRRDFNPASSSSAQLQQMWLTNRENEVKQGKAAAELAFFRTFGEISALIQAIDQANYRHSRIASMAQRGLGEAADSTQVASKTLAYKRPELNASRRPLPTLYQLEKKLLEAKRQALANEFSLLDIMKRRGIDVQKHMRKAAGLKGENVNQTSDFKTQIQPQLTDIQQKVTLSLDGPKYFSSPEHLVGEIDRVTEQTNRLATQIQHLFQLTGGMPKPYQPDPESVLD